MASAVRLATLVLRRPPPQDKAPLRSQEQIAEQLIDMFCVPARAPAAQAQAQAPKTGAAYTVREEARAPAPAARHVPVPGVPTTGYACYGMLPPTLPQGAVQVGAAGPWAVRIRPCAPGGQVAGAPVPVTVPSVALSSVGASAVPPASQGSTVPNRRGPRRSPRLSPSAPPRRGSAPPRHAPAVPPSPPARRRRRCRWTSSCRCSCPTTRGSS